MDAHEINNRFYRQLFLRRYTLLLEKVEHTYPSLPKETLADIRKKILSLAWVDVGVERIATHLAKAAASTQDQ
jgi:hypothetical protein